MNKKERRQTANKKFAIPHRNAETGRLQTRSSPFHTEMRRQEVFHCNFFPKNRKGDRILSVYWFAILIIVAGGIFGMVYVFYGTPYDVRELEAKLMINKIADCVSYAGRINSNLISEGLFNQNFNLSKDCNLIFDSEEWETKQYYAEINFYKIDNPNNVIFKTFAGNNNLVTSCDIQQDKEYSKLAKCERGSFYSIDSSNNQYIIKILASIRKAEKNVKI